MESKKKVLLLGDACIDIYQYGHVNKISPEAPVPIISKLGTEYRQGMALNVRNNLTALGVDVECILGKESTKTRYIDAKSKQQMLRVDNDIISENIHISDINHLHYDAIVVSDYNKGTITYKLIEELRRLYSGPIFIDSKKNDISRFEGCFVKINEQEYQNITSTIDNMIVTLGENGVLYQDNHYLAKKVEVCDVCGAGDTFLASLVYKYLYTSSMYESIEFAILASSITVQHLGVHAPTLEEILCD